VAAVLVTGVAGFIGSRLAERLIEAGDEVVGIDRLSHFYDVALKQRNLERLRSSDSFRFVEADLNDIDLEPLVGEAEVVYHLAAQPGVRVSWGDDFAIYARDNILATQRLLEAARAVDLPTLVAASSSSVYGDAQEYPVAESTPRRPISPYGVTKLASEELCRLYATQFGVTTVGLRYFTIFGPRQRPDMAFSRFIAAGRDGNPIEVYGDGLQVRDFTFVDDAVAATIAAASRGKPGSTYNVAGGTQATVLEVIEQLRGLLDKDIEVHHKPAAPGDVRRTGADSTLVRTELGFTPSVPLAEGLRLQVEAALGPAGDQAGG
jgi:UDP-glucuronate 4-epimerase